MTYATASKETWSDQTNLKNGFSFLSHNRRNKSSSKLWWKEEWRAGINCCKASKRARRPACASEAPKDKEWRRWTLEVKRAPQNHNENGHKHATRIGSTREASLNDSNTYRHVITLEQWTWCSLLAGASGTFFLKEPARKQPQGQLAKARDTDIHKWALVPCHEMYARCNKCKKKKRKRLEACMDKKWKTYFCGCWTAKPCGDCCFPVV